MNTNRFLAALMLILMLTAVLFLGACKKNSVDETFTPIISPEIPDLTTAVNSRVYGFITDETGNPVDGATVVGGAISVITDQYGYFRISSAAFPKSAGFIKITKTGYYTGYRTFVPVEGGDQFFRLQLVPRTVIGTIDASSGGTVTITGGGKLTLPANGMVVASSGTVYPGAVDVSMHWFDPSDAMLTGATMPGDLRGVDSDGHLQGLTTFGMLNVELYGSSGELLQVAPGMQASLSFPIPASILATAPATIPLWYFKETTGLWVEEGVAIKNGNNYEGQVSHFTPWNCDVPTQSVTFTAQIISTALTPLPFTPVTVELVGQPNASRIYYTDSAGFISGVAPISSSLEMKVLTPCNGSQSIKTFSTANNTTPISLGAIQVNNSTYEGNFTGTLINCSGQPVTDGYVLIIGGGYNQVINVDNGVFDYHATICAGANASVIGVDNGAGTQGNPQNIVLATGVNNLGVIAGCVAPVAETITYSIDGTPTTLSLPLHLFNGNFDFANDTTVVNAIDLLNSVTDFDMGFGGPAATGNHNVGHTLKLGTNFYTLQLPTSINITTYGLIGEFITGTINTTILDAGLNPHSFTCTINIKRDL